MRTFDYTMNAIKLLTPEIVQMIGRICKAQGELVGQVVLFGHAVLVLDVGIRDRVQHQVYSREAQHRRVSVKAREGFAGEAVPLRRGHRVLIVRADGKRLITRTLGVPSFFR